MLDSLFDSHAHYDDKAFDEDRDAVLSGLPEKGVCGVINCATNVKSIKTTLNICNRYDFVYGALGIHPHDAKTFNDDVLAQIKEHIQINKKIVAIGEIGLDYHYDFSPRYKQIDCFKGHLELARELNLPVIIHDREAHEDTLNLLKEYKPRGVVHFFSGSVEMAKEIVKLGMYIGIGGTLTFKNAKKIVDVAQMIPMDSFLLETDCPYAAPVPFRGERCTSDLIEYTAKRFAAIKGIEAQEVVEQAQENTINLFSIK